MPGAAVNLLMGAPILTPRQVLDEIEAASIEHVRAVAEQALAADRRRLLIGPDGVSLVDGRQVATVYYADCVGMLSWADGARSLFGSDAINIHVEPRLWRLPRGALEQVDTAIPASRVAHMPDRPAESLPRPSTGRAQRMRARLRPYLRRRAVVPVAVAVALVVLILLVPHSNGPVEVGPALVTGITVGLLGVAMRLLSRRR